MARQVVRATVIVNKVGRVEDYVNLPIVREEVPIGIITEAEDTDVGYKLTIALWQSFDTELINERPSALHMSWNGRG